MLNVLGFACYTTSTGAFLFNSTIREQYAIRHPAAPVPTVRGNDFAFAVHALLLCVVVYSQLWHRLWGFEDIPGKRASRTSVGVFWGSILGLSLVALIVVIRSDGSAESTSWAAIDIIYATSYVKLFVTCMKYAPQAWHNYKVKSTSGWAIGTVLLDLLGGVLSIAQLLIDSGLQADWSGVTGNPVKLGLANVSIFFDIIFITQHYVLYRGDGKQQKEDEETPLLE